jgi:DNA-binding LytR/AlgR family response regulator
VNLHHVERVEYADERWLVVLQRDAGTLPVSRRIGRELLDRLARRDKTPRR